ncbi:hypothetical protein ACIQVK_44150 [Streptomyces sp. NPDC090493]|uniref:hypothetical protein n=1 Tax=Streptomyces sp. NPDC090493 TaxID=3365964 RepID=UPI003809AA85
MVANHSRKNAARTARGGGKNHRQAVDAVRLRTEAEPQLPPLPTADELEAVRVFMSEWTGKVLKAVRTFPPDDTRDGLEHATDALARAADYMVCELSDELFHPFLRGTPNPNPEAVTVMWGSLLEFLRPMADQPGFPDGPWMTTPRRGAPVTHL